jgi:hypothetical protein
MLHKFDRVINCDFVLFLASEEYTLYFPPPCCCAGEKGGGGCMIQLRDIHKKN